jgi:phosphoribosylformimino-5-aminoimidazole carboxamide ribotide isomerase
MLLIPAIDLRAGRCVRLLQGNFGAETRYAPEPRELLERYEALGAPWLHVVDLDGARDGACRNRSLIIELARTSTIKLQVGGGLRSVEAIEELLEHGVARVIVGSAAVTRCEEVAEWLKRFGAERIGLAFDVRVQLGSVPWVRTHGWMAVSDVSLWDAVGRFARMDLRHVLCTDIARDGTLLGPNFELYRTAVARFPQLKWQASGGVRDATDLAALARLGLAAAVSGKALLEERITQEELRPFLRDASSPASTYATVRS